MSRLVIMTVGKTHSGKTTFARELELVLQQAIVIVYFNLPNELLEERIAHTQRSHAIFRSASNFQEVLERQVNRAELGPTEEEADYLFEISDPDDAAGIIRQIEEIANRS